MIINSGIILESRRSIENMKNFFKIGEISKLYGIGVDSIRYYEEIGIINLSVLNLDIAIIVFTTYGD